MDVRKGCCTCYVNSGAVFLVLAFSTIDKFKLGYVTVLEA